MTRKYNGTSWVHDYLRDQPAHMAMGLTIGFVTYATDWRWIFAAGGVALLWGAFREIKQWGELNSPSLDDSIKDTCFVGLGGVGGWCLHYFTGWW